MHQSFLKLFLIVVLVFATGAYTTDDDDSYCDGSGWIPFRDEKCYKLIKKWTTQTDAKEMCSQELLKTDSSHPQLVAIKSIDEQDFLTDFIFNTSGVKINVWTGAKRVPNSNQFVWDDGSSIESYTNWAEGSPTEKDDSECVVMHSEVNRINIHEIQRVNGKWRDVTCESPNYVVCEKFPRWSIGKLQQTLVQVRKKQLATEDELAETKTNLAATSTELVEAKSDLAATKTDLSVTKTELTQTINRVTSVESNPVPIGFIYVQLSNQPEPQTLWPAVQWKNVTSEYAGLFFRAEGGGSAQFGTVQSENTPRVTQVNVEYLAMETSNDWWYTQVISGSWSSGIGVFSGYWNGGVGAFVHKFYQAGGENRPRNIAMRVWKRIS